MKGEALVKTGAEGVFCGTVPNTGLGIAIKCDDGATRAAETVMANLLLALVRSDNATLKHWANPLLHNRGGIAIGEIRLAKGALAGLGGPRSDADPGKYAGDGAVRRDFSGKNLFLDVLKGFLILCLLEKLRLDCQVQKRVEPANGLLGTLG